MNGKSDQNKSGDQDKSGERIAKVIARAGLASRREAEAWIEAGRVAVNDETIRSPALDVTTRDRITIDGAPLPVRERTRLFLYHKPRGLLTTHADPQGRPTIFEKLPADLPRLISVGRLDFNTEGLLLLTNDGALARALELPATGWLRRYRVRAHGEVTQAELDGLRRGVTVSGIHYGAIEATLDRVQGSNLWLTFAIREGKNREVRNVLSHLGLTVTRLIRVSFGPFQLTELDTGEVEEVKTRVLREQLGEKLAAFAEVDFSGPITPRSLETTPPEATPPETQPSAVRNAGSRSPSARRPAPRRFDGAPGKASAKPVGDKKKTKARQSADHAWRAREEERPTKLLRRTFHGKKRADDKRPAPSSDKRAGILSDRKGRPILVERYGKPPVQETPPERDNKRDRGRWNKGADHGAKSDRSDKKRGNLGRRRSPDRGSGPRPRQPRGPR